MLTRQHAIETIRTYIKAWESQDPDLIVSIFTPDATYHERVLGAPIPNREAIRDYWETKVVDEQATIIVELLSLYVDGDTCIAEWQAEFDDLVKEERKRMREVAILTFSDGLVCSLREYWASQPIGELH